MNTFRELSEEEKRLMIERGFEDKNAEVCYVSDKMGKFTTCLLRVNTPKEIYVGNSKRATYGKMADEYNELTGRLIALGRAIKHFVKDECSFQH